MWWYGVFFFFSSRRRHTRSLRDWSSDVCSSDLPLRDDVDAQWRLGVRAAELDATGKRVLLADGSAVEYDRLLIATGTRARPWHDEAEAALDGVFTLRTSADAAALRQRLAARP